MRLGGPKAGAVHLLNPSCFPRTELIELPGQEVHGQPARVPVWTGRRVRIERAKPLLLRGDQPIKRIARELGFCDPAHFSNVFRRVVGM